MSGTVERKRKRRASIHQRVASKATPYASCRIFDCKMPTRAASGKGLNRLYCRSHEDHFQRHGSYTKRSYKASELTPHRATAMTWLAAHCNDIEVLEAVEAVRSLMRRGGPVIEAFRLRGLSPEKRAKATWARLRQANVDPLKIIAVALSVELAVRNDAQPENHGEFKQVQLAKSLHRMVSGTHKRWEREKSDGSKAVITMHIHPPSRGRILRHIGAEMSKISSVLVGILPMVDEHHKLSQS